MKKTALEAGKRSEELLQQGLKYDDLTQKVKQTTELQRQQLTKMDEIINIFKLCSEEMQKEKVLNR